MDLNADACGPDDGTGVINFYERDYYVFSNFSAFTLQWKGLRFDTSEAAYHWEKFPNAPWARNRILNASSAHEAFIIANASKANRVADWDERKEEIMYAIITEKVKQHEYVFRKLLQTGSRKISEQSWRDDYWGCGPKGDGKDRMGFLWMQLRADIYSNPEPWYAYHPETLNKYLIAPNTGFASAHTPVASPS